MSEALSQLPISELYQYNDGNVNEVFKEPGAQFDMDELAARIESDSQAKETGCAYVQTVDDSGARSRYYFDRQAMFDPQTQMGTRLEGVDLTDPGYAITVGATWHSPLGVAKGKVEAVAMPWTNAINGATAKDSVSPLSKGRKALDWVVKTSSRSI